MIEKKVRVTNKRKGKHVKFKRTSKEEQEHYNNSQEHSPKRKAQTKAIKVDIDVNVASYILNKQTLFLIVSAQANLSIAPNSSIVE